ncbi:hypothetical protein [Pseudomonas phage vB_PaS-HSN4]|nr:hypothetical protein [Pseudomonas phage vB_PaS-HSN4]
MISSGLDCRGRGEAVHLKLAGMHGFWKSYLAMSFHGLIANGYTGYPLSNYMFSTDWDDLAVGETHVQAAEESTRFGRPMANRDAPGRREWARSTPWRSEHPKRQPAKVEVVAIAPQPTVFGKQDPCMTVASEVGGVIRLHPHTCEPYGVVMLVIMGERGWSRDVEAIAQALDDFIEKHF